MRRRFLVVLAIVAAVFAVGVVGASVLNLNSSDSAPGEAKTNAACANHLLVKTPVNTAGHDANSISHMDITGDLTQCVGQTLRVEVDLASGSHVWAVRKITSTDTGGLTLQFDSTNGDFRDTKPIAQSGELAPMGSMVGPVSVTEFGLTTVTIAQTWS